MIGGKVPERCDTDCQLDLFGEWQTASAPPAGGVTRYAPALLSDAELVSQLSDAGPSDIDALCVEIIARSPPAAVPALERLWRRFQGFGIDRPLREQRAVLEILASLRDPEARSALKRIVLLPSMPTSLQPTALRAAVDADIILPASFVASFLDHADAAVRGAAFDLALRTKIPATRLRDGLLDVKASIRVAAAVALARQGDGLGRDVLVAELTNAPSILIVEALGAIGDDEAIVALGRCAARHSTFAPDVIKVLRTVGKLRADRLATRLEEKYSSPITENVP